MGSRKTHEQFIEALAGKGINVEPLEEYINSATAINCKCRECGHIWKIRPNNLLSGYGCPECGIKRRARKQTKDEGLFIKELELVNPQVGFLGPYSGARTPSPCRCKVCGHSWSASPTNLLKGKSCPICAKKASTDKRRRSQSEFIDIVHKHNPNIEVLGDFKGNAYPISLRCNSCGYEWTAKAGHIVSGTGCPRCAGNGIYSQEEFVKKLKQVNPNIEVLGKYERANRQLKCRCLRCGNTWMSKPNNLLNGKGCPECSHSATSFVEQVILGVFQHLLDCTVLSRDRSYIGKELDILIPDLKLAIEPGSWRWHRDKAEDDELKRKACEEAGIRLITIYTDYFPDAKKPFETDCICVREGLGYEKDSIALYNLVDTLLNLCGISKRFTDQTWKEIMEQAYLKSRRMTTDEFIDRIHEKSETVEVIGEYTGSANRIKCRCSVCGNIWSPFASSLLKGSGCPKCAKKHSKKMI